MKNITVIPVGILGTNCILVKNPGSNVLYIIDPGGEGDKILQTIRQNYPECKEFRILLTHAHADHILAVGAVAKVLSAPVFIHPQDHALYFSPDNQFPPYLYAAKDLPEPSKIFPPDDSDIQTIYTPGHTPGGCSYYFPELKTLFAGDTLFCESIGRTDFPGGNYNTLIQSIQTLFKTIPGSTTVISGHGENTTIDHEMQFNPYLN